MTSVRTLNNVGTTEQTGIASMDTTQCLDDCLSNK